MKTSPPDMAETEARSTERINQSDGVEYPDGELNISGETQVGEPSEPAEADIDGRSASSHPRRGRRLGYFGLAALTAISLAGAGFSTWQDANIRAEVGARSAAVSVATETTTAILSYTPDNAATHLPSAADSLTGAFRDEYVKLINDVVIPGSQENQISAVASVPASATVSASSSSAVVLLFVNQVINIRDDPPTNTSSAVQVTLEKVDDRWLISQFDPV